MLQEWNQVPVTRVAIAIFVKPGTGKIAHKNRPLHGFVINCEGDEKEYVFSDGQVLQPALQLLESGQFAVSEVAAMCGYAEPCHFSREFSARVGVSPNQYK